MTLPKDFTTDVRVDPFVDVVVDFPFGDDGDEFFLCGMVLKY
jgi:hypothetical protein